MFNLQSPFCTDKNRPEVFVARSDDPYTTAREAISGIDLSIARGLKVLLKPNAGRVADPSSGVVTNPRVLAAVADAFLEAGASVAIGESPITGVKTMEALEAAGHAAVARERGITLIDFDAVPPVKTFVPEGVAIHELQLCAPLLQYDLIVSIPVMKTHMHTGVTLAVKNMKGCLWRRSKVAFHMLPPVERYTEKSLGIAIADMAGVLRPHLSVIDGTIGMQGLGPSAGSVQKNGCVVAGADAFAADAAACALMGTRAELIPHLYLGARRGYGIIDLEMIKVCPGNWRSWAVVFEKPPENIALQWENVTILDKNSCSACQSTLLLFLKKYGSTLTDYFPEGKPVNIAIGKGHTDVPEGTLCIGNCTAAHKARGIFVKGCPPVGSEILRRISNKESDDRQPSE